MIITHINLAQKCPEADTLGTVKAGDVFVIFLPATLPHLQKFQLKRFPQPVLACLFSNPQGISLL